MSKGAIMRHGHLPVAVKEGIGKISFYRYSNNN
jgi:hypothetical protein